MHHRLVNFLGLLPKEKIFLGIDMIRSRSILYFIKNKNCDFFLFSQSRDWQFCLFLTVIIVAATGIYEFFQFYIV